MVVSDVRVGGYGSRPNLKDVIASEIRDAIFSGDLRPGSRIDQDKLASELGVSRLPIREALIALENESLVENIPRRGSFVAPLSRTDVFDHYNILGLVSGIAVERATANIGREVALLGEVLGIQCSADDADARREAGLEFHRIIHKASQSRRLLAVLRGLAAGMPRSLYCSSLEWEAESMREHREMYSAIAAGDGSAARAATEKHMRTSAQYAVEALEARGFWSEGP